MWTSELVVNNLLWLVFFAWHSMVDLVQCGEHQLPGLGWAEQYASPPGGRIQQPWGQWININKIDKLSADQKRSSLIVRLVPDIVTNELEGWMTGPRTRLFIIWQEQLDKSVSCSRSCSFRQWPSRRQRKIIFVSNFFCFLPYHTFWRYIYIRPQR